MAKVTSKLQVTATKAIGRRYGVQTGGDIRFEESGEVIRTVPADVGASTDGLGVAARLRLFDAATARQERCEAGRQVRRGSTRGWTREDLYEHGRSRAD